MKIAINTILISFEMHIDECPLLTWISVELCFWLLNEHECFE